MADHPLRSATDLRLGRPLPHQLPNRTRAHLSPDLSFDPCTISTVVSCGISAAFAALSPCERQIAHALLTRPPLRHPQITPQMPPLDLHVLGTPPAFVLSQDQTLAFNPTTPGSRRKSLLSLKESTVVCASLLCAVFKVPASPRLGCPMNIPHPHPLSQAPIFGIFIVKRQFLSYRA